MSQSGQGIQSYSRGLRPVVSSSDIRQYDLQSRQIAANQLVSDDQAIGTVEDVHARPIVPAWDLNQDDAGTTQGDWSVVTGGAGSTVTAYWLDDDNAFDSKTAVIYGIRSFGTIGTTADNVANLIFQNRTGGTIDQWEILGLQNAAAGAESESWVAVADNPIELSTNEALEIEVDNPYNDFTDTTIVAPFQLLGVVAEQSGTNLEESNRFVA